MFPSFLSNSCLNVSIVQYFGSQLGKCGYCTGTKCSKSNGMLAYHLMCQDYQDLIDRGWRRCGKHCYKLKNKETCCPCYAIKCDALEFKLTKSNKRILRRMNRFLLDGKRDPVEQGSRSGNDDDVTEGANAPTRKPQPQMPDKSPAVINVEQAMSLAQAQKSKAKPAGAAGAGLLAQSPSLGSNKSAKDISYKPCKKAKQMRLERRQAKLGDTKEPPKQKAVTQEKSLTDFLSEPNESYKHQLKLSLVDVDSEEFIRTLPDSYALYRKYQISIHNDPPKDRNAYVYHLQDSPMENEKPDDGPEMGYGSFHQQYWLDDKLIAVGVIDILPGSVSSVYFFYDPDYSFLSLGTYGSLREIDFVQTIAATTPAVKYYYMGFYIHSCPKMRYKGNLSPSYLLCPETYVWILLTDVIRSKLDANKYQRLNDDAAARDVNEFTLEDLGEVTLLMGTDYTLKYKEYWQIPDVTHRVDVIEYSELVGKVCAQRMLYVIMK
ncbi:arginyl-tRNA--protein transferase 1 isoform X2 [Drosophila guanche]|uniref:Arginyl-tRNA--protein transferase 1 n=1 Tax=Drosophila guanche TaxID=7266 RepID=A0A3B0J2I0_DROGU|nr:arginyl-tRNA--protein transferase 1 isoform X2 [Drosophila guanche]SPP73302.1 blast:Arginyl-tRNA--protein transferase 1 [Drosophila guanche]